MTLKEAIRQGIKEVTIDPWNEYARLELPAKLPSGTHGPWTLTHLIDPWSNLALGQPAESRKSVLIFEWGDDGDWRPWVRPADYERVAQAEREREGVKYA